MTRLRLTIEADATFWDDSLGRIDLRSYEDSFSVPLRGIRKAGGSVIIDVIEPPFEMPTKKASVVRDSDGCIYLLGAHGDETFWVACDGELLTPKQLLEGAESLEVLFEGVDA